MTTTRMPTIFLPHGGGPCFFMEWTWGPRDTWFRMADFLKGVLHGLAERPRALLVVSAHWEESVPTVSTSAAPSLFFDYYGFPPETYKLTWPARGSPQLAERARELLSRANIASASDPSRGFDHGVFVPLKLGVPHADIPTVCLSLKKSLSPAEHLAIGRALEPLRNEGVLIVGSGMSYHNLGSFNSSTAGTASAVFNKWLVETCTADPVMRDQRLSSWQLAPKARECHPREEHLIPLMVAAGAAGSDVGKHIFEDVVMGTYVSAFAFGAYDTGKA